LKFFNVMHGDMVIVLHSVQQQLFRTGSLF
jgi:hypothetical protein